MHKLSLFLSCILIACSAHAMEYEVIGPVKRRVSIIPESGSSASEKIIIFKGIVRRSKTNEFFKATIKRKFSPAFVNLVLDTGKFSGMLKNIKFDSKHDLQTEDAVALFTKLSASHVEAELVINASRDLARKISLEKEKEKMLKIKQQQEQAQMPSL